MLSTSIRLLERYTKRELDPVEVLLLYCGRYTHLLELYTIFGKEALLEFLMSVFAVRARVRLRVSWRLVYKGKGGGKR